ncbi:MAG: hypothetical protein ACI4CS_01375 [Candidatus Weimeria sp.]
MMTSEKDTAEKAEVILAEKVRQQWQKIDKLEKELAKSRTEGAYFLRPVKTIFNDRSTIIYWNDGTKTVVTCREGDEYSKEKGYYLCFLKRIAGNTTTGLLKLVAPVNDPKNVRRTKDKKKTDRK